MLPSYAYRVYDAAATDVVADLQRLAELDSQPLLRERVIIGEIDGAPAAAISLADLRIVTDPRADTTGLKPVLRSWAQSLRALDRTPELRDRLRAAVRVRRAAATRP